jgi:inhibitor of cysteine peptidase
MKTTLLFVFLLFTVGMASGCKAASTKLTSADNSTTVNIKVGDPFTISLEGNPSTGYSWEAKDLNTDMLEQTADPEFKSDNPGLIGSGGTITLSYKALKAGTTTLTLLYHRSWETAVEPQSAFTVTIVVK